MALYQFGQNRKGGKICGKLGLRRVLCVQSVHETVAIAAMDKQRNIDALCGAVAEPQLKIHADARRKRINQKRSKDFQNELNQGAEHGLTVALFVAFGKEGKHWPWMSERVQEQAG